MGYLESHADPDAKVNEAIALISGLVSLGGRMLLQLAQSTQMSENEILRIMGQRIALPGLTTAWSGSWSGSPGAS